ncbi:hypothetical protein BVC93_31850 (plasmid) [Mycobacterium sp. MS1601]|nr:hypothetical protein BVC93_31850 [Mycobacterium sp. MS1601]
MTAHTGPAQASKPHIAATYFSEQLAALIQDNPRVRMLNTGRTRTTKALTVHKLIQDHCPSSRPPAPSGTASTTASGHRASTKCIA